MFRFLAAFSCFFCSLFASEGGFVVLQSRNAGMFSVFYDALALLKAYDDGLYTGIEIDFGGGGLYYSPKHGGNWWSYYCEPICFGKRENVKYLSYHSRGAVSDWGSGSYKSRMEAKKIIDKYVQFKPFILEKIEAFKAENFADNYVIGVHYRGTDKKGEAYPVSYEEVMRKIQDIIIESREERYKIFIATDEQSFLDCVIRAYGDKVCYNTDAFRSSNGRPLHVGGYDRYRCGLDAVIDAILLSKGDYLIRMVSNLSQMSIFLNPDIPVYQLNQFLPGGAY